MFKHTFAVCAYKKSPFLEECIKSLLNQTVKSNIIIATSTPNDYINLIAEKYNLKVFVHDGGGIASDWNFALNCAGSRYCTLAHQDDVYLPNYWAACQKALERCGRPLIAFTDYREIAEGSVLPLNLNLKVKELLLFPLRLFGGSRFVRRRILSFGSAICCPSVTYNLEALRDFRFDPSMTVSLDWDAWERISRLRGSFCYLPRPLMWHRIHAFSETTHAIQDNRRSDEDLKMLRRFWGNIPAMMIFRFYSKSQRTNRAANRKP